MSRPVSRFEAWALAAIGAFFVIAVIRSMAVHAPFEYDEAVYAQKARAWVHEAPDTGWAPYRAPGLPAIASPLILVTDNDVALRIVGLLSGLGLLAATWGLARAIAGPIPALIATATVASVGEVIERSGQFLTDIPMAALLTLMSWVLWRELEQREQPTKALLWIAPIVFATYSVRYAAAPMIVITLTTAAIVWRRKLRGNARLVGLVVGLTALLLLPHAVWSLRTFGNLWGQLTMTLGIAARDSATRGLGTYLAGIPRAMGGFIAGAMMLAGIGAAIGTAVGARRENRWSTRERATALIAGVALADIVALGLTAHAETRYVLFPITMLIITGADAVLRAGARLHARLGATHTRAADLDPRKRTAAVLLAPVAVLTLFATTIAGAQHAVRLSTKARTDRLAVVQIARLVGRDAFGPCSMLVPAPALAQATWYSGCTVISFEVPPQPKRDDLLPEGTNRYLMLVDGYPFDPRGALRRRYLKLADSKASLYTVTSGGRTARAWRLKT